MAALDRSLVANLPMFAGLSPSEQDELLREARSVRYPKGSAVFDQGAEADGFFLLLHGHLRVEKTTPQGQQTVVRYVSAGELFGVAQAMNLTYYPATAVAAVDSIALAWPSSSWQRLIVTHASAFVSETRQLRESLEGVFVSAADQRVLAQETDGTAQTDTRRLGQLAVGIDDAIRAALTASNEPVDRVELRELAFWRTVRRAERLAEAASKP